MWNEAPGSVGDKPSPTHSIISAGGHLLQNKVTHGLLLIPAACAHTFVGVCSSQFMVTLFKPSPAGAPGTALQHLLGWTCIALALIPISTRDSCICQQYYYYHYWCCCKSKHFCGNNPSHGRNYAFHLSISDTTCWYRELPSTHTCLSQLTTSGGQLTIILSVPDFWMVQTVRGKSHTTSKNSGAVYLQQGLWFFA